MPMGFTPYHRRLKVLFGPGDSITVGTGNSNTLNVGGWRAGLANRINTRLGEPPMFVGWQIQVGAAGGNMCGASGQRVDQLISGQYGTAQYYALAPDCAFIHWGTNNATQLNSGAWPTGSVAITVADMSTGLDAFRAANPQIRIFLAKIIPNVDAGADSYVNQINSAMVTMVAARSDASLITIVDQNGAFKANASWATDYMADNTHPNEAGYAVMVNTWYASFISIY